MRKFRATLWRSLLVALIYTAATALSGALVMQGIEAPRASQASPAFLLVTTFLSGFLLAAVLGPVAAHLTASRLRAIAIWVSLVFLNGASVILEGYFFAPGLLPGVLVPRVLVLQAFSSLVAATALAFFFPSPTTGQPQRAKRTPPGWVGRFAASAAAYLLFYYFFGAINYALVTGPYYEAHGGLAVPPPGTVIAVASVRAVLIIFSLLPLIRSLNASRKGAALLCGFLLFAIGGLLPLLSQTAALPPGLLIASGMEIFFQNFLTGALAALLLTRPLAAPTPGQAAPAVAHEAKV